MSYQIRTISSFEKAVKELAKKYRNLKKDLEQIIKSMEKDPYFGVAIPGYEGVVWKLRIANTSAKRGKQGGFRIIYLIEKTIGTCYLLTIYSKTGKSDVSMEEIEDILKALEKVYFSDQ